MDQRLAEEDSLWDEDVAEEATVIAGGGDEEATPAGHDTVSRARGPDLSAIEVFCNELFGVGSAFDSATSKGAREGRMALSHQTGPKKSTFMPGSGGFTIVYPRLRQALVQGWRRAATGQRVESACQEKEDDARSRQADGGQMSDDPRHAVANPVPPTPSEVLTASSVRMMLGMASALRTSNPEALQVICSTLFDLLLETPPLVLAPLRQSPSSIEATTFRKVGNFCAELLGSANPAEHQPARRLYLALAVSKGEVSGLLEVVNCFFDRARLDAKDGGTPALLHFPGGPPPLSTVAAVDTANPKLGQRRERDVGVSAVLERLANQRVTVDPPFSSPCNDGPFGWKGVLRNLADDPERPLKGSALRYSIPPLSETAVFVLAHLDRLGAHYLGCKRERAQAREVGSSIPYLQKRGSDLPFCFDLAPETFRHLADLVEKSTDSFETAVHGKDDDKEKTTAGSEEYVELYVLCASLRLLNVNIGILLGNGLGVEEFGGEGLRRSLLRCLLGLVRHCETHWTRADFPSEAKSEPQATSQIGRGKAAGEALRLLVDGIDLFYPSQGLQASLLSAYLRAFGTRVESHTTASHALVLELLCRTSSPDFLRSFLPGRSHMTPSSATSVHGGTLLGPGLASCEEPPRTPETFDSFAGVLLESSNEQAIKDVRHAAGTASVGRGSAPDAESALLSDKLRESSEEVGQAVLRALGAVLNLRCVDAFQAAKKGRVEGVDSTADIRKFLMLVLQASSNVLAAAIEARRCATAADVFERVVEAVCNGLVGSLLPSCLASALALPVDATDLLREPVQQHLVQLTRTLRLFTMAGCAPHGSTRRSPSLKLKDGLGTLQADFGVEGLEQESLGSEGGVESTPEERLTKEGNTNPEARSFASGKLAANLRLLARVERLCSALGASLVRRMVRGKPRTPQEKANAKWLVHPLLLHAEVISGRRKTLGDEQDNSLLVCDTTVTTPAQSRADEKLKLNAHSRKLSEKDGLSLNQSAFVHQLSMNPASRESRALSIAMRRVVLQDRGGNPETNDVVWSVALASVYHAGFAGELAEVARAEINWAEGSFSTESVADSGAPMNPSPALVRAWRSAQTARVRLTSDTLALVLQRAHFLLFLEPWVSTKLVEGFGSPRDASVARALKGSELVLECLLGPVEAANTQGGGGGAHDAEDRCAVLNVDARETDPSGLLHIIDARSERATTRARGFELAAQLLDGTSSDRATADVLRAVADGLLRAGSQRLEPIGPERKSTHQAVDNCDTERLNEERETTGVLLPPAKLAGKDFGQAEPNAGRLHFVPGTECCDPKCKLALVESVADFLSRCSTVLEQERIGDRGSAGNRRTRRFVLAHALRAVSMDYEFHDHDLIQRSHLLPPIARLVDDTDLSVAGAASRALQAVYRCAVPAERGMSDATWERVGEDADGTSQWKATRDGSGTPFQVSFFGTVRSMLERTARAIGTKTPGTLDHKPVEDEKTPTAGTPTIHIESTRGGAGSALGGERMLKGEMEARAAQVLALAHASCRVECGRRELTNVDAVRALLRLVLLAEPEMRGWALRVCLVTLPWVAPRLVHDEFRAIVRERQPSFEGSFVECSLLLVGQIAGVWTRLEGGASYVKSDPLASSPTADKGCVLDMLLAPAGFCAWRERVPARDAFSLSSQLVSLLHKLVAGAETDGAESAGKRPSAYLPEWQEELATVVCRCLQRARPIMESLERHKTLEETRLWAEAERARVQLGGDREGATSAAVTDERNEAESTPPSADGVDRLMAVLSLLGGQFEGLYPGARVLCRLPPGESSSDFPGGWEDRPTVEATVLRLPFSGTKPPGGQSKPVGDPRTDETTSADGGIGDGAGRSGVENAEAERQMTSRVFSARLLPRPAGCARPLDVYEGLPDEGFARGAEASAAVARQVHERRRLERQQRLMQEHRALSLRMQGARFGRVSRPHGQGRPHIGGEQPLPDIGQSTLLSRSGTGDETVAMADDPTGGGSASASSSPRRQRRISGCKELVTVGFSRDDPGVASVPHTFTVPVDSVTLLHKGVPGALVRTLTSYVPEFLPGLKAMLEAETVFRGPTYAPLLSASRRACIVESAHPYRPGEDHIWPISVAGAETVELSFDAMSRVARPEDHIALSWRTPSGGSGHRRVCPCSPANHSSDHGGPRPCEDDGGGSQAWPGVGAEPPLLVMANELTVRFVTDIALDATSAEAGAATGGGGDETWGARPTATRAWGFRLTAVSPKVPPKTPRPQPPSKARATLCDLRARASLSLASVLEHGEMSARLAPMVPVLVKAALGAASEVAIGGDIPGAGTPQPWMERRLARAYDLLHRQREPPSRLPEAEFVRLPYSIGATPPPQSDTLGESSTVDTSADRLVNSPSTDSCSSESTSADAGYVGGAPPLERINSPVGLCSDEPWPRWEEGLRRYVVCIGGVGAFDKPKLANGDGSSSRQLARLRHGATVAVVAQQRDWLKVVCDSKAVFTPTPDDQLPHSTPPADFWVRQRQDETFFLMPEALAGKEMDMATVADCPDLGSKEGGVIVSMLLGDEYDDEEKARFAPLEGVVDRTEAEREAARSTEGWDASTIHYLGDVGGGKTIADDDDRRDVQGQTGGALWASTVDTLCAATATFGVSALLTVAARWQGGAGTPSYLDLFGSARSLWEFLRLTSVIEKGDRQSAAFSTLKQRVGEYVASEGGGAFGGCLAGHALGALRNLAVQPGIKAVARVFETPHPYQNNMNVEWDVYLPKAKRIKVVFDPRSRTETSRDWVDIILQDPEGGAVSSRVSRELHHRFHGRGGRENFPGFGGRLPLWLEGNRFVARFQSDPTATDWGVRFTAYGILDCDGRDSSGCDGNGAVVDALNVSSDVSCGPRNGAAQGVAAPASTGIATGTTTVAVTALVAKGRAGTREVELCCWVLDLLSCEGHAVPEVASRLCDNSAFEAFEVCLKTFSQQRRLIIVQLITGIVARVGPAARAKATAAGSSTMADSQNSRASAGPSYADTRRLLQAVLSLAETQRAIEDGSSVASPYLQGLVECAVVLRDFLVDFADWPKSPWPEKDRHSTPPRADHATERESPKAFERKILGAGGARAEAVKDVASIWSALRDFSRGTAPGRMLVKDFLPMLTEACSVVVQSAHPFDRLAQRRVVLVPGAVGVQVRFDHRTEMREDDRIVIRDPGRRQPTAGGLAVATTLSQHADSGCWSGIGMDAQMVESCNLLHAGDELGFSGLSGGRSDGLPLVSVGDHVVRGPDWAFGDEDCPGRQQQGSSRVGTVPSAQTAAAIRCARSRIGIVVALEKWGERDGAGVRVRWATEQLDSAAAGATRDQEREGFEALYCVQNPAHVRVVTRGGEDRARRPIVRAGSSVEIEVVPGAGGKGDATAPPPSGGQSDAHLFRFDGESTHVDLPSYRGMRLEGDFTLEVWAWLDLGCAQDGKLKCVVSRVLHQPSHQAKGRGSTSGEYTRPAPSSLAAAAESEQPGSPPPAHATFDADESSENLAWSWPVSPHEVRNHARSATGPSLPGGVVAAETGVPPRGDGDLSPMEGTLVSPPASSSDNANVVVDEADRHVATGANEVGLEGAGRERGGVEKRLTSTSGAVKGFVDGRLPQPLLPSGGTRAGDNEEEAERYACGEGSIFVEGGDGIEESKDDEIDGEVRGDNVRANRYEAGGNGKLSLSFGDDVPSAPQDVVVSSITDSKINIRWSPPARVGCPVLHSYIIFLDDVEIASVGAGTLEYTNTNRPPGSPCSYSVAARGAAGTSLCTTAEDDSRTQLALSVGGQGEMEFSMGNERGKGVVLGAGQFQEGVWTHLAVSVEGRTVSMFVDGERRASGTFVGRRLFSGSPSPSDDHHHEQHRRPSAEPLRLGSRGAQDFWRGRLGGLRVWGAASQAVDIRRRIPARAGGVLEGAAPGGPPMPKEEQYVWGLSLTVSPLFPSEFAGAHPWLGERFEKFAALVWGEKGQALASNAELVRYVNAVASRKGLSKESLLTCDWAALQAPGADLADWPLLQSLAAPPASRTAAATAATTSVGSSGASSGDGGGGVEETKQCDPPSRQDVVAVADDGDRRDDEWVVATAVASGPERRGVRVRKTPLEYGNVSWRLPSGQAARLLPPPPPPAGGRGTSESSTGGAGWRRVRGAGGDTGWLPLNPMDATGSPVPSPLQRVWARRFILDWFSPEAAGWPRGEEGDDEGGLEARAAASSLDVGEGAFWLPLRGQASTPAAGDDRGAAVRSCLSPLSAARLLGNSDALLLSAVDAGGGDDRGPLLVTGKWTVGLVTDTLTVTTRTSGCTRVEAPSVARDGSANSVGGKAEQTADPLPVLVDGLVFGFRAVDGLLVVTRAFPTAAGARTPQHAQPVEQQALAWLGGLDEGAEVSFSIVDSGQDVVFSCREVGAPRRTATVRAKCRDSWGRGRVALGCRSIETESSTSGWVRVTSQAHGATVRSGRSIDADGIVGRIPCGTVVPFDNAVLYHSPGAPDRGGIEPVIRYRCLATATTPAGWISERGRYANHPYRICEQILARPQQTPASISHVSVARVQSPAAYVGGGTLAGPSSIFRDQSPPPVRGAGNAGSTAGETPGGEDQQRRESEWQQRLGELAVLPARFHLLQQLNRGVSEALRYVDLSQGDLPWSVAGLLSRCRHLVFFALRQEAWRAELARTSRPRAAAASAHSSGEATPPSLELRLSRGRAARHGGSGTLQADQKGRQALFCQAFFSMRNTEASLFRLRPGEVLYSTVFVGEHAHDAGGPYRESFAEYCAELQSGALPLLMKCPNSVNDVGINREKWLPNPAVGKVGPSAALHAEMLGFLGRLMGVAIRSQEPLDLDLPSIVWKQLVRSPITREDLEAVDFALTQSLKAVRNIHLRGVATDEAFRDLGLGGFEVVTADGRRAGLPTPGGAAREVTLDNRLEFADMVEEFKTREYRVPVEAIRRGLASVVPIEHLRLFSWDELEVFVCGRKEVDVDLLEACTEYTLCCRQDSHVSAFWDVLRSFSQREKSLFLRFAWGRSRLPLSADQFHQSFKIQAFARTPADAYLPVAHTCFFSLELPRYSSREVLETKLRYAISNCRAMDADDTSVGRTAAGLGWGEDP